MRGKTDEEDIKISNKMCEGIERCVGFQTILPRTFHYAKMPISVVRFHKRIKPNFPRQFCRMSETSFELPDHSSVKSSVELFIWKIERRIRKPVFSLGYSNLKFETILLSTFRKVVCWIQFAKEATQIFYRIEMVCEIQKHSLRNDSMQILYEI